MRGTANMETINGYELVSDEMATSSAVSWKAKKDGQYFFLKKFRDPARPRDAIRVHNPAEFKRRSDWCDRFEDNRKTINALISNLGGGNFVAPVEFFLHKNKLKKSPLQPLFLCRFNKNPIFSYFLV